MSDSRAARTLAYDLIEQLVFAHADAVRATRRARSSAPFAAGAPRRVVPPRVGADGGRRRVRGGAEEALIQRQQALLEGAGLV